MTPPPPYLYILKATIPANQGAPPAAPHSLPLGIVDDEGYLSGGPLGHDGKELGGQNHNLETDKRKKYKYIMYKNNNDVWIRLFMCVGKVFS